MEHLDAYNGDIEELSKADRFTYEVNKQEHECSLQSFTLCKFFCCLAVGDLHKRQYINNDPVQA